MKFKHSCFTENTPDNREWLEKLGYEMENMNTEGEYILTYLRKHDGRELYWCAIPLNGAQLERHKYTTRDNIIDCRSNPSLFKAVSAVREDSDYMQWFVNEYPMSYRCNKSGKWKASKWFVWNSEKSRCSFASKATLSELIEKFPIDRNLAIKK